MRFEQVNQTMYVGIPETEEEIKEQEEMFAEFQKICCDCEQPDGQPYFVKSHMIKGVGRVNHHGWVCHKCRKYVQVG